jgi:hypothetical protein
LIPIQDVLDDILAIPLNGEQALRLRQGQQVDASRVSAASSLAEGDIFQCIHAEENLLLGMATLQNGNIKAMRMFNL